MPRNYKKKGKSYNEEDLKQALAEVHSGKSSIREAARAYGIDKSLLCRRLQGKGLMKTGRKTALTSDQEMQLRSHLQILAKWGFALTKNEVISVVADFVSENNIQTPFKDGIPGNDWFRGFCKRNRLNLKKLEALDTNRRKATSDPYIIYNFYNILEKTINEMGIAGKPQHVWNLDETYFCSDPQRIRCVTGVGQKAHRTIQGSGKENTTVLACCSAAGKVLPPLIIFSSGNLWSSWKGKNDIPGTFYANSEKGYMTSTIFSSYMRKFAEVVEERPILMVFDGHLSHMEQDTIEFARNNQITILKLPPHTTDLLQPLDKCCFGPLKAKWNETLVAWQRDNQRRLMKSEFVDLICSIWFEGLHPANVISGFKTTGIFPCDRSKYPKDRLNPDKLKNYLEGIEEPSVFIGNEHTDTNTPQEAEEVSDQATAISDQATSPESPSTPKADAAVGSNFESLLLQKIKRTSVTNASRRRIDVHARVITSEEYKDHIERLTASKEKKKMPVAERKKSKKTKSKDEDEDEEWIESEDSLDNIDLIGEKEDNFIEMENLNSYSCGDYVLVCFKGGKRMSVKYRYLCVIQSIFDNKEVEVMAMRSVDGQKDTFKMKENDVSVVNMKDIMGKVPVPKIAQVGDRLKYTFEKPVDVYEL